MRGQRVGRALDQVIAKGKAHLRPGLHHLRIEHLAPFKAAEFGGPIGAAVKAIIGDIGVELIGKPLDIEGQSLSGQDRHRHFKTPLAHKAPGADRVG
jgi:hypothetical protein